MERVQITLPRDIPSCPFTQKSVVEAVMGVCSHFFEKSLFQQYIAKGGRNCPLCNSKITWYVEVPRLREALGEKVTVLPITLEGEHRIEHDQEVGSMQEGIVLNLFLIEQAVSKKRDFLNWCMEQDRTVVQRLQAQLIYDSVAADSQLTAVQAYVPLAKKLYDSFDYNDCGSIQEFVNKLLADELSFFLYTLLLKETAIHQCYVSANQVMGGKITRHRLDIDKVVDDAVFLKKIRALIGLVLTLSLMIGVGRQIFGLYFYPKNNNFFSKKWVMIEECYRDAV